MQSDYETLGVPPSTPPVEVKAAYRQLVRRWHPDRFQQAPEETRREAEDKLKGITAAYRRISEAWMHERRLRERARSAEGARGAYGTSAKPPGEDTARQESSRSARASGASRDSGSSGASSSSSPANEPRPWQPFPSLRNLWARWRRELQDLIGILGYRTSLLWRLHLKRPFLATGMLFWACLALSSSLPPVLPKSPADVSSQFAGSLSPDASLSPEKTTSSSDSSRIEEPLLKAPGPDTEPTDDNSGVLISRLPTTEKLPPAMPPSELVPDSREQGSFFSLGATQSDVLRVQGPPARVKGHTWMYGLSEVHFKEGRVVRFNNFDGSLKIRLLPSEAVPHSVTPFITLGSHKNDVIRSHGTPSRVAADRWYYGFSEVRFKGERVVGYDNFFKNLAVRMEPSKSYTPAMPPRFFTVGSSQDEVLAIQGTPTGVQGNLWFYELSNIQFRDGKVLWAFNSSGNLHFVPPEQPSAGSP